MSGLNCHKLCIVGVVLGNGGAFVLGVVNDAVVKEQIITFA
jgi:hypothetical protein